LKLSSGESLIDLLPDGNSVATTVDKHVKNGSPFILTVQRYPTENVYQDKCELAASQGWNLLLIAQISHRVTSYSAI
jgi:hypothetical protein